MQMVRQVCSLCGAAILSLALVLPPHVLADEIPDDLPYSPSKTIPATMEMKVCHHVLLCLLQPAVTENVKRARKSTYTALCSVQAPDPKDTDLSAEEKSTVALFQRNTPSVVNIANIGELDAARFSADGHLKHTSVHEITSRMVLRLTAELHQHGGKENATGHGFRIHLG